MSWPDVVLLCRHAHADGLMHTHVQCLMSGERVVCAAGWGMSACDGKMPAPAADTEPTTMAALPCTPASVPQAAAGQPASCRRSGRHNADMTTQPSCSEDSSGALVVDIDSDGDAESGESVRASEPGLLLAAAEASAAAALVHHSTAPAAEAPQQAVSGSQHAPTSPNQAQPTTRAQSEGGVVQPGHQPVASIGEVPADQAAPPSPEAEPKLDPVRAAACRRTFRRFGKQQAAFDCADRCR